MLKKPQRLYDEDAQAKESFAAVDIMKLMSDEGMERPKDLVSIPKERVPLAYIVDQLKVPLHSTRVVDRVLLNCEKL